MAVLADVLHVRAADAAFNGVTEALVRALLPCVLLACATGGPCLYCLEWKEWGHLLVCRFGCPLPLDADTWQVVCGAPPPEEETPTVLA